MSALRTWEEAPDSNDETLLRNLWQGGQNLQRPEYNKATWEAKNLEIENSIKTITEGITGANLTEAEADAQKAVAEWNSAMAKAEVDQATKKTAWASLI